MVYAKKKQEKIRMVQHNFIILDDWMTTSEMPFHSKITEGDDDNIYHVHDFYEIFYILDGNLSYDINGETMKLSTGDMGFVNKSDVHSFFRGPGNTCKHRDIIIRTELFESVCKFIGKDFEDAYMHNALPKVISLPFSKIEQYEERIVNLVTAPPSINSDSQIAHIKTLLVSLLNCLLAKEHERDHQYYPMWFRELLGRFHMNDFLKNGLDSILEPYHFSKAYMCRTFQKYMDCTMTEYLNDIRLQHAAFQLTYTDDTIINICNSVGFASVSYFNSVFKRKYGMSPNVFRKTHKTASS